MSGSSPWSYPVRWVDLPAGGTEIDLTPDAAARLRIARALDVEALARLSASLALAPWLDGVEIKGRLEAAVTRTCGITLEPFEELIDEPMVLRIVPWGSPNAPVAAGGEVEFDLAAADPPDTAEGEGFDLGDYVVEHLALALDPFPRKPGAVFEAPSAADPPSPFAVLARLKSSSPAGKCDE